METRNIIKQFITQNEKFKIIKETRKLITPITNELIILDSSFNPPHLGHYSMIKQSILDLNKRNNINTSTINNKSILLLFSIENADKQNNLSIDTYVHRINMIDLMTKYIDQELGLACGIGLIKSSLFIDKSNLINDWLSGYTSEGKEKISQFFLLGYDTVIRLFNMKYYPNSDNINEALKPLFDNSKICVFLRKSDKSDEDEKEITKQIEYLKNLQKLLNDESKILICMSENEWNISSSSIRNSVQNGNDDKSWNSQVIHSIRDYINRNGLYQ